MDRTELIGEDAERRALTVFSRRLRALREERNWSLGNAEAVSGVTRSYWRKLETGNHQPGLIALLRVQRAFGLASLDSLFGPMPTQALFVPPAEPDPDAPGGVPENER
jgi:transcriptional regulator with XRE-family HTH domain